MERRRLQPAYMHMLETADNMTPLLEFDYTEQLVNQAVLPAFLIELQCLTALDYRLPVKRF